MYRGRRWERGSRGALPDVEMLRGISEALRRDMLCFFGTPQGEDEQRCRCIRMIEDLCGEKDTAHFAWQEDVPSGADYQGVAVTAEAYRENGFYYCIRSVYKELHADHETRVPLGTRLCVAKCSVLYALSALP